MGNFILVGAKPTAENISNPGGQVTASIGLIDYALSIGYKVEVIDTTQSSFPVPALKTRFTRGFKRVKKLFSLLQKRNIDGVIIFSSAGFSFYERIVLSLICQIFRVPDVFFIRSGHFYNATNLSLLKRIITRVFLKIPRTVGAQGEDWVKFYQRLGVPNNRIVIIRNWLSKDFPISKDVKKCDNSTSIRFVFVGWLVKEKGVIQLLNAALKLSMAFKFELHLVGGGTLEQYSKEFIKSNHLSDHVFLHGWQDKEFIINLLNISHVFILPSEAEGFPNALLEAMSLGLASICTQVGGVADSLKNNINGFLIPDNSMSSILSAMTSYLEQPRLIEKHSNNTSKIYQSLHAQEQNCKTLFNQFKI